MKLLRKIAFNLGLAFDGAGEWVKHGPHSRLLTEFLIATEPKNPEK